MCSWIDEAGLDCDHEGVNKAPSPLGVGGPRCQRRARASLGSWTWQVSGAHAGEVRPFSVQARSKLGRQTWAVSFTGHSNPSSGGEQRKQFSGETWLNHHPCPDSLLTKSLLYDLTASGFIFQHAKNKVLQPVWTSSTLESWFSLYKWINWLSHDNLAFPLICLQGGNGLISLPECAVCPSSLFPFGPWQMGSCGLYLGLLCVPGEC